MDKRSSVALRSVNPERTTRVLLTLAQVQQRVPLSRTTIFRMENAGDFPKSVYISPNRRVWYEDEITEWQTDLSQQVHERKRRRTNNRGRPVAVK